MHPFDQPAPFPLRQRLEMIEYRPRIEESIIPQIYPIERVAAIYLRAFLSGARPEDYGPWDVDAGCSTGCGGEVAEMEGDIYMPCLILGV